MRSEKEIRDEIEALDRGVQELMNGYEFSLSREDYESANYYVKLIKQMADRKEVLEWVLN